MRLAWLSIVLSVLALGASEWQSRSSSRSFFFQAEDGIRALYVTGVQTCALPIFERIDQLGNERLVHGPDGVRRPLLDGVRDRPVGDGRAIRALEIAARVEILHFVWIEIGRASCREREQVLVGAREVETNATRLSA